MNNCKYCGKTWGEHYGADCYASKDGTEFVPIGSLLTDICERCGDALEMHSRHCFCIKGYGEFEAPDPPSILTLLPEELFEL